MKRTRKLLAAILAAVTLATAAAIPAHAAVSDVKPSNWAYNAVQYNVENKLIAIDYSKYNMNAPAPRQDVAYAMFKLTNGKDVEPTKLVYTQYIPMDMQNSPDKYKYSVQWACVNEIIAGTKTNGKEWGSVDYRLWFSPTAIVTREQMATLLYRLAYYDKLDTTANMSALYRFDDGLTASTWAQGAIAWCVDNKLMSGVGNNKLSPKTTLTFGQLAQFMKNYGEFKDKSQEPVETPTPTPVPTVKPGTTYHASYYSMQALPIYANTNGYTRPAKQDFSWLNDTKTHKDTDYLKNLDLSGPWDTCKPLPKTWLPEGGYMKDGHRYNKYHVCIDDIDGLPTESEKKAFLCLSQHRVNNGLNPLEWDQAAQVIAEIRSLESVAWVQGGPAHARPDGDTHIDAIINECKSVGILTTKTSDGWLNENGHSNTISSPQFGEVTGAIAFIASAGHNETLLASNTTHGAISDLSGVTVYIGLQMH